MIRFTAFFFLMITSIAWGTSVRTSNFPPIPVAHDKPTWVYQAFRVALYNIDLEFKRLGIEGKACAYESHFSRQTKQFKGLGPCLFENFMESMKTKNQSGITYIWIQTTDNRILPLRLDWRPSEEGWGSVLREVISLKFESVARLWNRLTERSSSPKEKALSYKQNFLGKIRITLPRDRNLREYFSEAAIDALDSPTQSSTEINFQLTPLFRKQGLNHYKGVMTVQREKVDLSSSRDFAMEFTTNLNVLKLDREIKAQGKIDL